MVIISVFSYNILDTSLDHLDIQASLFDLGQKTISIHFWSWVKTEEEFKEMKYITENRASLTYELRLAEVMFVLLYPSCLDQLPCRSLFN
jgi:hypothetical protein